METRVELGYIPYPRRNALLTSGPGAGDTGFYVTGPVPSVTLAYALNCRAEISTNAGLAR